MPLTLVGYAKAHIPGGGKDGKASYIRVGTLFQDGDRYVMKIDTLPIPGSAWQGWINVFPEGMTDKRAAEGGVPAVGPDEIPF